MNDSHFMWLNKFGAWLDAWKQHSATVPHSFLTKETFTALSHTIKTVQIMIPDLLTNHQMQYILLAKFQTDNLESRFGLYRQLSGSNYLVSVKEVMQSERKLKVRGLLRLFTGTRGVVSVKEFLCSFSDLEKDKQDTAFIHAFPYCDMNKKIMDVSELLMVTGFIAKKTIARTSCKSCKANLGSVGKPVNLFVEEEVGQYFDLMNRGGLTSPSNLLFNVTQYAYLMFNVRISSVECTFLEVAHQKQTFLGVIEQIQNPFLTAQSTQIKSVISVPIKDFIHHYPRALFNDIPRVGAHFYDIPGSGRTFTTYPGRGAV